MGSSSQKQASGYRRHCRRWSRCRLCKLCQGRRNVVLARGQLPAHVLMIGEAPGVSEDVLGRPFCGPAGHLLDYWIEEAIETGGLEQRPPRLLITNLLACVPLDATGAKTAQPPDWAIRACRLRLLEVFLLARPQAVVFVGSLAAKHAPKLLPLGDRPTLHLVHPAAVLRQGQPQYGLACQRAMVELRDLFAGLVF